MMYERETTMPLKHNGNEMLKNSFYRGDIYMNMNGASKVLNVLFSGKRFPSYSFTMFNKNVDNLWYTGKRDLYWIC